MNRFDIENVVRIERMYASAPIAEQRVRTRAALALRPGESGLELGCGTGLLACEIAREVGTKGGVIGLDSSPAMIEAARERAERENLSEHLQFVVGDVSALDFPSESFDFAVAVQVYLYVTEIDRALPEAARVIRQGGRFVIVDTDWDSCVWLTANRERHRRILEARLRELGQPHLPPLLPRLLRQAGFELLTVEAHPILNLRYEDDSFSAGWMEATPRICTKCGITPAEVEAWMSDLKSRTSDGDYFFSVNRYLFLARR